MVFSNSVTYKYLSIFENFHDTYYEPTIVVHDIQLKASVYDLCKKVFPLHS